MTRRLAVIALALAAVGLSGCVSVFPKSEPAQLYRFEATVPQRPESANKFGVLKLTSNFVRAAASDRILTVNQSGEVAYIAQTRWVSPASVLFDEEVAKAFQSAGRARLVSRGEITKAAFALKLDVVAFEVAYDQGPKAAPQIVVMVRGVLTNSQDRTVVGDRLFSAKVRAGENRVGAIVPALNQALSQTMTEIVGWVDAAPATAE